MAKPLVAAPINVLTALNFQVPTPPGFPPVPQEQVLASPMPLETLKQVEAFLDHLLLCGCGGKKDGFDWVIPINGKYYGIYWRDKAPRPPWTREVWDVYCFQQSSCPLTPRNLGYFWCWEDVIAVIRSELRTTWRPPFAGGVVIATGTNTFQAGSPIPQVAPRLWLDAADTASLVLNGPLVEQWCDKSTLAQHASQATVAQQPELVPNTLNGLATVRFTPATETFMNVRLRSQASFHLFVVGRFNLNPLSPRGIFLAATGIEPTFSGLEGGVFQDTGTFPVGTPYTVVQPSPGLVAPVLFVPAAINGQFTIFEWSQHTALTGRVQIGNNSVIETVYTGDTSGDGWDTLAQAGGSPPVFGSLGRQNQGVLSTFDYLDGDIGEVVLYPEVLSTGQRISVLNNLRAKWGLGAPLGLPDPSDC